MEYLDIRTMTGEPTGEVKERSLVHRDGDLHGTSHVWIVRWRLDSQKDGQDKQKQKAIDFDHVELLLQKRSATKDAYPGCYDISSAGHVPAGQDYLTSALRELKEELGIVAEPEDLHFLGTYEGYFEEEFYGRPFRNHELAMVYLYDKPIDLADLTLQEEEVESVRWMSLKDCQEAIIKKDEKFRCLIPEEIRMITAHLSGF